MPVLQQQYICVKAGSIGGILQTRHPNTYKFKKHRNTDVHVLLHRCEIWHLILGEEMYKDTHEQGAGGNTWIQEAETDTRISKTA